MSYKYRLFVDLRSLLDSIEENPLEEAEKFPGLTRNKIYELSKGRKPYDCMYIGPLEFPNPLHVGDEIDVIDFPLGEILRVSHKYKPENYSESYSEIDVSGGRDESIFLSRYLDETLEREHPDLAKLIELSYTG